MENILPAVIILGLLLLVGLGIGFYMLTTQAALADASQTMQLRVSDHSHTSLTPVSAVTNSDGEYVQVIVQNTGTTKQANFKDWDVILQYTDLNGAQQIHWYSYTIEWTGQIYQSIQPAQPEVVEPGILNPGEYLAIQIHAVPTVKLGSTNLAVVTAPNGITVDSIFTH